MARYIAPSAELRAVLAPDRPAALGRRQSLPVELLEISLHLARENDALDGTDLREALTTNREAGVSGRQPLATLAVSGFALSPRSPGVLRRVVHELTIPQTMRAPPHTMLRTTPPSTRSAAPLVAEACREQT